MTPCQSTENKQSLLYLNECNELDIHACVMNNSDGAPKNYVPWFEFYAQMKALYKKTWT